MAFARACWPPTALDCEDLHRDGGKPPSLKFLGSFGNPSFQLRLHKAAVVQSTPNGRTRSFSRGEPFLIDLAAALFQREPLSPSGPKATRGGPSPQKFRTGERGGSARKQQFAAWVELVASGGSGIYCLMCTSRRNCWSCSVKQGVSYSSTSAGSQKPGFGFRISSDWEATSITTTKSGSASFKRAISSRTFIGEHNPASAV